LEKLQQDIQPMKLNYQSILGNKEEQLQTMIGLHKDYAKIEEFITKALALNAQLLQQEETVC